MDVRPFDLSHGFVYVGLDLVLIVTQMWGNPQWFTSLNGIKHVFVFSVSGFQRVAFQIQHVCSMDVAHVDSLDLKGHVGMNSCWSPDMPRVYL